uniref:Cyclin dependent kinase 9 n=1 Tax=Brachionus manjavacas TaxID=667381 RepID=M4SL60_9BILA|nr:Cyclin dependent kinase 9 [Brachionus manjavacas]
MSDHFDCKVLESAHYPFCPDHSKYEHIAKIGQGTFGEVHKAKIRGTAQIVALKKVLTENEKEGFPITALREIKILQVLKHENIVRLIEICTTKASAENKFKSEFYLVFEFCEHDLAGLLSNSKVKFSLSEQKKVMQQLLNGLYYIHKNFILHRDMKTANILVTKEGKLKLADFGLARAVAQTNSSAKYTNRVVTLWYRSPELLLGEKCYNKAIDMWGAGCIMAELWTKEPILKGGTEQHQLELIQNLCGPITTEVWPEVDKLELFNKIAQRADQKRKVKERLGNYIKDVNGLDLLDKLLTLDPKKRIDSDEALDHDFFWTEPLPSDLKLEAITSSNFEYTAARRNQYRQAARHQNTDQQHFDRVY